MPGRFGSLRAAPEWLLWPSPPSLPPLFLTVLATFALSVPLARFDVWWTRLVGRVAARIVPDPAPAARVPAPAVAEGGMGGGWVPPQPSERKTA